MTGKAILRTIAASVLIVTAVATASGTALAAEASSPAAVTALPDDSGWQGTGS